MSNSNISDHASRRVLVADDEVSIREVMQALLGDKVGCGVVAVDSGDAALEQMGKEPFDVLVTDMVMPGLHGIELIRAVKNKYPAVDIIVLTGFADIFPYVDVVNAGASDFIRKPCEAPEIEAKLMRVFRERKLRERLTAAEQKYRGLFELSMEGNVLLDPGTFLLTDANMAFCLLAGCTREELVGSSLLGIVVEDHRERVEAAFQMFRSGGQGAMGDIAVRCSDGRQISVDISITFMPSLLGDSAFLTIRDVTERREVENLLAVAAQTDPLTGLSNKRMLYTRLDVMIPRARREEKSLALMFIDLDNFKQCNDTHGHVTGDLLISSVGGIIKGAIRGADEGFRYGGDEFAVLLPGATPEGAKAVAERMRQRFETTQQYGTTMSIGIAMHDGSSNASQFLTAADVALYRAKSGGKNLTHVA